MGDETKPVQFNFSTNDRKPFAPLEGGATIYDVLLDKSMSANTEKEAKEATEQLRQAGVLAPDPHKGFFSQWWDSAKLSTADTVGNIGATFGADNLFGTRDYVRENPQLQVNPDADTATTWGGYGGQAIGSTLPTMLVGTAMQMVGAPGWLVVAGQYATTFAQEYGGAKQEYLDAGLSEKDASLYALVESGLNSAIEIMPWGAVGHVRQAVGGMTSAGRKQAIKMATAETIARYKRMYPKTWKQYILRFGKNMAEQMGGEGGEEVLQGRVTNTMHSLAGIDDGEYGLAQDVEAFKSGAIGTLFSGAGIGGAAIESRYNAQPGMQRINQQRKMLSDREGKPTMAPFRTAPNEYDENGNVKPDEEMPKSSPAREKYGFENMPAPVEGQENQTHEQRMEQVKEAVEKEAKPNEEGVTDDGIYWGKADDGQVMVSDDEKVIGDYAGRMLDKVYTESSYHENHAGIDKEGKLHKRMSDGTELVSSGKTDLKRQMMRNVLSRVEKDSGKNGAGVLDGVNFERDETGVKVWMQNRKDGAKFGFEKRDGKLYQTFDNGVKQESVEVPVTEAKAEEKAAKGKEDPASSKDFAEASKEDRRGQKRTNRTERTQGEPVASAEGPASPKGYAEASRENKAEAAPAGEKGVLSITEEGRKAERKAIERISRGFGVDVVYVNGKSLPSFMKEEEGAKYVDGKLYVREDLPEGMWDAFHHDFKHFLDDKYPDVAKEFNRQATDEKNLTKEGKAELSAVTDAYGGDKAVGEDEFRSDSFMRIMREGPEAWNDVHKELESRKKGLGRRFLEAVANFFKRCMSVLKSSGEPSYREHFYRAKELRDAAIKMLADAYGEKAAAEVKKGKEGVEVKKNGAYGTHEAHGKNDGKAEAPEGKEDLEEIDGFLFDKDGNCVAYNDKGELVPSRAGYRTFMGDWYVQTKKEYLALKGAQKNYDKRFHPERVEDKEDPASPEGFAVASVEDVEAKQRPQGRVEAQKAVEEGFGAKNKVFTKEQFEKDIARLKEMTNRLNAGIDPEYMVLFTRVSGYYIEGGIRKFADYAKKMVEALGEKCKPFLKGAYENIRRYPGMDDVAKDMDSTQYVDDYSFDPASSKDYAVASVEDKEDVEDKGDAEDIEADKKNKGKAAEPTQGGFYELPSMKAFDNIKRICSPERMKEIGVHFFDNKTLNETAVLEFAGEFPVGGSEKITNKATFLRALLKCAFRLDGLTNVDMRVLKTKLEQKYNLPAKAFEEVYESNLVFVAQQVARDTELNEQEKFGTILSLYQRQMSLNERDADSVSRQAYSTPLPLGYLLGNAIHLDTAKRVFEPTAGNGALVVGANPEAKLHLNEMDKSRHEVLKGLYGKVGNTITNGDFFDLNLSGDFDGIIMNPPFGRSSVKELKVDGYSVFKLENQIAAKSLEHLAKNGKCGIIMGANIDFGGLADYTAVSKGDESFYNWLYGKFNVVDHFVIDGKLYGKQGTTYPIRVILIDGVKSDVPDGDFHKVSYLDVLKDWPEVYFRLNGIRERTAGNGLQGAVNQGRNEGKQVLPVTGERADVAVKSGGEEAGNGERQGVDGAAVSDGAGTLEAGGRPDGGGVDGGVETASGVSVGRSDVVVGAAGPVGRGGGVKRSRVGGSGKLRGRSDLSSSGAVTPIEIKHVDGNKNFIPIQASPIDKSKYEIGGKYDRTPVSADADVETFDPYQAEKDSDPNKLQLSYQRVSGAYPLDTVVPRNLATEIWRSLKRLEKAVEPTLNRHDFTDGRTVIDEYVIEKCGLNGFDELVSALGAEQVEGCAQAIYQMEHGGSLILTDQTGVGKGRQQAMVMRYCLLNDKVPIFFTEKPNLFTDMKYNDCIACGVDIRPLVLSGGNLMKPGGEEVGQRSLNGNDVQRKVFECFSNGDESGLKDILGKNCPGDGFNAIFTNYTQFSYNEKEASEKGKTTKRTMLEGVMRKRNCVLFLDECHNAAAEVSKSGWGSKKGDDDEIKLDKGNNTYQNIKKLAPLAKGILFTSATYAKRGSVLGLYRDFTDMKYVGESEEDFFNCFSGNDLALLMTLSRGLAASGQLIRREKSFEGVKVNTNVVQLSDKEIDAYNKVTRIFAGINHLNIMIRDRQKAENAQASSRQNDVSQQAKVGNFASKVTNIQKQLLFILKCESAGKECLRLLKEGKKPVLFVSNTMGAFLDENQDNVDEDGDLDIDYKQVLRNYVYEQGFVNERDVHNSKKSVKRAITLTDSENAAMNDLLGQINALDIDLPGSPIDAVREIVEGAGYKFGEITGRTKRVVTGEDGKKHIEDRKPDTRSEVDRFNNGDTDVILINKSGSTGLSIHASERVKDKRVRVGVVLQPDDDINVTMQMLGRINRSGQVVKPEYEFIMSNLTLEMRAYGILSRKMNTMNAQTSGDKDGLYTLPSEDMENKYGNNAMRTVLYNHPDVLAALTGDSVETVKQNLAMANLEEPQGWHGEIDYFSHADLFHQRFGQFVFLDEDTQKQLFAEIEDEFHKNVEEAKRKGDYGDLSVGSFIATPEGKDMFEPAIKGNDSVFASAVYNTFYNIRQKFPVMHVSDIDEMRKQYVKSVFGAVGDNSETDALRETINLQYEICLANIKAEATARENEIKLSVRENKQSKEENLVKLHNTVNDKITKLKITYDWGFNDVYGKFFKQSCIVDDPMWGKIHGVPVALEARSSAQKFDGMKVVLLLEIGGLQKMNYSEFSWLEKYDSYKLDEAFTKPDKEQEKTRDVGFFEGNILRSLLSARVTGNKGKLMLFKTNDGDLRTGVMLRGEVQGGAKQRLETKKDVGMFLSYLSENYYSKSDKGDDVIFFLGSRATYKVIKNIGINLIYPKSENSQIYGIKGSSFSKFADMGFSVPKQSGNLFVSKLYIYDEAEMQKKLSTLLFNDDYRFGVPYLAGDTKARVQEYNRGKAKAYIRRAYRRANPVTDNQTLREEAERLFESYQWDGHLSDQEAMDKAREFIEDCGSYDSVYQMLKSNLLPTGGIGPYVMRVVVNSDYFKTLGFEERSNFWKNVYARIGSETGQRLRAFREDLMDSDTVAGLRNSIERYLSRFDEPEMRRLQRVVLHDYGIDIFKFPEEVLKDKYRLDEILRDVVTHAETGLKSMGRMASEVWINFLLSGLKTHAVNTASNLLKFGYEVGPKRFMEALLGLAFRHASKKGDKKMATFGEYREMFRYVDWKQVWSDMKDAFNLEILNRAGKLDAANLPAIPGKTGRVVRLPSRILLFADAAVRGIVTPMEAAAYGYRMARDMGLKGQELRDFIKAQIDMKGEAYAYGIERAKEFTFTEKIPGNGKRVDSLAINALMQMKASGGFQGLLTNIIFPFVKTTYNLLRQGVRMGHLGSVNLAYQTAKALTGKRSFDDEYVKILAEQILCWGLTGILLAKSDDDDEPYITGDTPVKGGNESRWNAQNIPPNSIKIGDTWYNYSRVEPISDVLSSLGNLLAAYRSNDKDAYTKAFTKTVVSFLDKSYFQTAVEVMSLISADEYTLRNVGANYISSWVPNIARQFMLYSDDDVRETRGADFWQLVGTRSGFKILAPKVDYFGRDVKRDDCTTGCSWLWRFAPVSAKTAEYGDEADRMLRNYNFTHEQEPYFPSLPGRKFRSRNGEQVEMTGEEYHDYCQKAGELAHKKVMEGIRRGYINANRPEQKDIELVKKIFTRARKETRERMFRGR